MTERVDKYFARHADLTRRPLVTKSVDCVDRVVVIPVHAEPDLFSTTFESLAANPAEDRRRTLVIAVVNNRARSRCAAETLARNNETLTRLRALVEDHRAFNVGFIDASSAGNELEEGQGVGQARKLGMDWALKLLGESGVIISLDGDTVVEADYLSTVWRHLDTPQAWACVIDYAHSLEGDERRQAAIVSYELYLRYHQLGLDFARSPFAFHAIGSAMALTSQAYVAISGMNKREAGEDFYFLQQLAKTGPIAFIHDTTVHPSSRVSNRVPFGTGASVARYLDEGTREYLVYHPDSYVILRDWLAAVHENIGATPEALLAIAGGVSPHLPHYLQTIHFCRTWERLGRNAGDSSQLLQQFHRWFDGLKTLKLIHHLRDAGLPNQEMRGAITVLLNRRGDTSAAAVEEKPVLLERLRSIARSRSRPAGIFNAG